MAPKPHHVILFVVGALLMCSQMAAGSPKVPPLPLCTLLTTAARKILPDPFVINDVTIPLSFGAAADVIFSAEVANITGMKEISFENCTVDPDFTYISDVIETLNVDFINYKMEGQLVGHLDIYGGGHSNVMIENFFVAAYGNLSTSEVPQFEYLQLDLDMYQWTVIFEHFMDGTDMGALFNEFFSEVGPESIDALEDLLNNGSNDALTSLVNQILSAALGSQSEQTNDAEVEHIVKNIEEVWL